MIKAVLLDIDNTLLDFNKCSELAIKKSFLEHGLIYTDEVFPTFLRRNDILWKNIEKGEYTRELLHKERWNVIFGELGIDYDGIKIEKSFLDNLYDCVVLIDGALEIVKYLSSKYYLCTASNAPNEQQYNRLKIAGIYPYIKKVFTSEALGVNKPLPEFFDKVFENLNGITPSQTVIIGDSLTADVEGGKKYGLNTVWYNHLKLPEPQVKRYDFKADSLLEIKNYL